MLSRDAHSTFTMLSGDVLAQSGSFSNSTPSGAYVGYENGASNGDGISVYPNAASAALFLLTTQAGSQFSLLMEENNGQGKLKLEESQGPFPYAVDANGRMTLSGTGGGAPVFYLANGSQIFGTEQPTSGSGGGNAALITLTQQSGSSFSCTAPTGSFFLGSVRPPVSMNTLSGVLSQSGGVATVTIDQSRAGGVLTQGESDTLTCSSDSLSATTGRFVYTNANGNTSVGYTISPNNASVLMDITPGKTLPSVIYVQK